MSPTIQLLLALTAVASDPEPWHSGPLEPALERARTEEHGVLIYFWMGSSDHCQRLWQESLGTQAADELFAGFVRVSADVTTSDGRDMVARYGIATLPTLLFVTAAGERDDAILGYIPTASLAAEVARVRNGSGTLGALRRAAEAAPDDLDARFRLAVKLSDVGDTAASESVLESIRTDDPRGTTVIGAQLQLRDVQQAIVAAASDAADPTTFDLAPLYEHVRRIRPDEVRFLAWDWAAGLERRRGERAAALRAYRRAGDYVSDAAANDWGAEVFEYLWEGRDAIDGPDRRFSLELARATVASAEAMPDADPATTFVLTGEEYTAFHASALDRLARALFLNGRRDEAREALAGALALEPANNLWLQRQERLFDGT